MSSSITKGTMDSSLALETLREIIGAFRPVERRLRRDMRSVPAEELDRIVAAIDGTLPSLTGAELGRALLFKAQVLWWHHFRALCRHEQREPSATPAQLGKMCAL